MVYINLIIKCDSCKHNFGTTYKGDYIYFENTEKYNIDDLLDNNFSSCFSCHKELCDKCKCICYDCVEQGWFCNKHINDHEHKYSKEDQQYIDYCFRDNHL